MFDDFYNTCAASVINDVDGISCRDRGPQKQIIKQDT